MAAPTRVHQRRQIWEAIATTATAPEGPYCTSFQLPAYGLLQFNESTSITLQQDALFAPDCSDEAPGLGNATIPITDTLRPFYSSTTPQVFVLGAMLVVAWSLVIILFITPTRLNWYGIGPPGGGGGALAGGHAAILGNGGRPWLQKAATLFVAVSICVAAVKTFAVLGDQYARGYEDATAATIEVVGSLELRIFRTLSVAFELLAQVQTLIRLFPRPREKMIIKWVGISLVLLDTLLALLNNFYYESPVRGGLRPRHATEALPALAYLFEMALSILYAAWVLYYAVKKRHFAFFHARMHNITIVAVLSIVAVLIPIGFFILDLSNPEFVGWGSYVQWVGEAAASVVVWEWVERIEAVEWDVNRDGILGREIFEGDEMLNRRRASKQNQQRPPPRPPPPPSSGALGEKSAALVSARQILLRRFRRRREPAHEPATKRSDTQSTDESAAPPPPPAAVDTTPSGPRRRASPPVAPAGPPQAQSPVSRSNDTSAASTVYAIRHHHVSPSVTPERSVQQATAAAAAAAARGSPGTAQTPIPEEGVAAPTSSAMPGPGLAAPAGRAPAFFRGTPNPFKRRRASPLPEPGPSDADLPAPAATTRATASARVARAPSDASSAATAAGDRPRLTALAARFRRHARRASADLPAIVVPVQPDGLAWQPSRDGTSARPSLAGSAATRVPSAGRGGGGDGSVPSAAGPGQRDAAGGVEPPVLTSDDASSAAAADIPTGERTARDEDRSGGDDGHGAPAGAPESAGPAGLPTVLETDEALARSDAGSRTRSGRQSAAAERRSEGGDLAPD